LTRQENFFKLYGSAAMYSTLFSSLYPSVMIAQAALESNYGNSKLTSLHNNFFGIKGDFKGESIQMATWEFFGENVTIVDGFKSYPTPIQGFIDRNKFLKVNPRYTKNGVFDASSAEEQTQALKNAGYATDPDYVSKIISIINKYNLKRFDRRKKIIEIVLIIVLIITTYFSVNFLLKLKK